MVSKQKASNNIYVQTLVQGMGAGSVWTLSVEHLSVRSKMHFSTGSNQRASLPLILRGYCSPFSELFIQWLCAPSAVAVLHHISGIHHCSVTVAGEDVVLILIAHSFQIHAIIGG